MFLFVFFLRTDCTHAPGVPACWPMRGSPPSMSSWTGVISCTAVITTVCSSTNSQLGLEKADRGRLILCILRSYTRCSCCFFRSRPLEVITPQSEYSEWRARGWAQRNWIAEWRWKDKLILQEPQATEPAFRINIDTISAFNKCWSCRGTNAERLQRCWQAGKGFISSSTAFSHFTTHLNEVW